MPARKQPPSKKPAPKKRTVKSDPKEIDFLVGVNAKNPKGRPRNFNDPDQIWKLFEEYKIYCSENPRFTFTASLGKIVKVPHFKPLTIEGFETFCYSKSLTISHYFENREGRYSEFCDIVTRIKREIRGDQLEGAFVGQYSSNIVARINGISEKTENINRNIEVPLFPDVQEDNSNK
jgi:hypothetical protein